MNNNLKTSIKKAVKTMYKTLPILLGVILLISLLTSLVPPAIYSSLFSGNYIFDPIIGGLLGSILAGNPITSYILGGELLSQGVSLIAVTSFIVCWVTVGLVQLPAESMLLGKKFAILRNVSSFISSIIVAILTVLILKII
ncbi:hypothetical protein K8R33_05025 [archaeon]|nr:hypothetical protein [archaeon]